MRRSTDTEPLHLTRLENGERPSLRISRLQLSRAHPVGGGRPGLPTGHYAGRAGNVACASEPQKGDADVMIKDTDTVKVVCGSCGSRYTARVTWIDSAAEFDCSCGAHLRAAVDDLFQIHHAMMALSEIILHPLHE